MNTSDGRPQWSKRSKVTYGKSVKRGPSFQPVESSEPEEILRTVRTASSVKVAARGQEVARDRVELGRSGPTPNSSRLATTISDGKPDAERGSESERQATLFRKRKLSAQSGRSKNQNRPEGFGGQSSSSHLPRGKNTNIDLASEPLFRQIQSATAEIPREQQPGPGQREEITPRTVAVGASLATTATARMKGPRLIDTLATQTDGDLSAQESEGSPGIETGLQTPTPVSPPRQSSPSSDLLSRTPKAWTPARNANGTKARGLKNTYSQQRSMLAETKSIPSHNDPLTLTATVGIVNSRPLSHSRTLSFSEDDAEDESGLGNGIRSLHELRQAGVNNRFADEMEDLIERVGKPCVHDISPLRRNAMLELAKRLQEKVFLHQFRDYGMPSEFFLNLAEEQDVIAGYAAACIVLTLMASSATPTLVGHLNAGGFSGLLTRLLADTETIPNIATSLRFKLSRNSQRLLLEIESGLAKLNLWSSTRPTHLQPRTVALKILDLHSKSPAVELGAGSLSAELTRALFAILGSLPNALTDQTDLDNMNCCLASLVLERHSIQVMESDAAIRWTRQYLPTVSEALKFVSKRPIVQYGCFEGAILKLSLNITNNHTRAAADFKDSTLFFDLAAAVGQGFGVLYQSSDVSPLLRRVYDSLVLMLGVMINLLEHFPTIRDSTEHCKLSDESAVAQLIAIYFGNYMSTSEADSVEKTQLNVAFGYLAVLLGYLCLYHRVREWFSSHSSGRGLGCLIGSIREFIAHHRALDQRAEVTLRLQDLAKSLEAM